MLCSGCEDRGIGGDASVKLKHQTQVLLKSEMAMKDDAVRFTFPIDEGTSSLRHVELISKDCSCVEPSFNGAQLHVGKPLRLQPNTPCVVEFDIRNQKKEAVDISRKLLIRISGYQDGDRDFVVQGRLWVVEDIDTNRDSLLLDFTRDGQPTSEARIDITEVFRRGSYTGPSIPPRVSTEGVIAASRTVKKAGEDTPLVEDLVSRKWQLTLGLVKPSWEPPFKVVEEVLVESANSGKRARLALVAVNQHGLRYPKVVDVGRFQIHTTRERTIQIQSGDNVPFQIKRAAADNELVSVTYEDGKSRSSHWLTLRFEGSTPGAQQAVVQITTDHPIAKEVDVKAYFYCVSQ
ncbi:MAG: hypothetical protein CMJ58_11200 [Planctomycetaceae bacterium]|nr:hypothetical protein [Planctomycetaceae bacterium]